VGYLWWVVVVVWVSGVLRQSDRYGLQGPMVAEELRGFVERPTGTATVPNPVTGGIVGVYLKPFPRVAQRDLQGVQWGRRV